MPIVAEARGGVPEIVSHGVNGLLGRSADEVGDLLRAVVADEELRATLARGARGSASRFSLATQLAAYENLLGEARNIEASHGSVGARRASGSLGAMSGPPCP